MLPLFGPAIFNCRCCCCCCQVTGKEGGYVDPENLQQAQQELLQLKSSMGAVRKQLEQLHVKARSYSDTDYLQYSSAFEPFLTDIDQLCDIARVQQIELVLRVQGLREQAARKVLFARTADAVQAVQQAADEAVQQAVQQQQPQWRAVQLQVKALKQQMQGLAWRYPPPQYVLWRFKGRFKASKPPLVLPGLRRQVPRVRQGVEQLPPGS